MVLLNNQARKVHRNIKLQNYAYRMVRDLITDQKYTIFEQRLSIDLAPFSIVIIRGE